MSGEHRRLPTTNIVLPYRRALVTGATGFIGAHLARALVDRGVEAAVLTRQTTLPQHFRNLDGAVRIQRGNLLDTTIIERLIADFRPEAIFHLAAYGTFPHERDIARMIEVNVKGTVNLLTAAARTPCRSFIHTGSVKEYAESSVPLTEESPIGPKDGYGASKASATLFCQWFAKQHGMPVTVLRLSPVYGPGDAETRLIPTAIRSALTGTPLPMTKGSWRRNFTYVDDVVDAFLQASARPSSGGVVNIGSPEQYELDEVLAVIEQLTGKRVKRTTLDPHTATAHHESWALDITRARSVLGWEPRVTLHEGLRSTTAWVMQAEDVGAPASLP